MANLLLRLADPAFGHPRGLLGRLGGAVMARGNSEQERWAVGQAEIRAGQRVLVVGHGPGIGLQKATDIVGESGKVIGVDPSETMRRLATQRCGAAIAAGNLELRAGSAELTGCADGEVDAAISVNNIMLWDQPAGFTELARVLRPAGRLVVTVHRHVLRTPVEQLREFAQRAGFVNVTTSQRQRRGNSPAVELLADASESPTV